MEHYVIFAFHLTAAAAADVAADVAAGCDNEYRDDDSVEHLYISKTFLLIH